MTFTKSIKTCFKQYANFKGRASRSEYWYWQLFTFIVSCVLQGVHEVIEEIKGIDHANLGTNTLIFIAIILIVSGVVWLATAVPSIAVAVRRLRDINKSGWWCFLGLLPVIGWIILIVWACKKGDDKANRYGEPPTK